MILEKFETLIHEEGYEGIRYFFLIGDPKGTKAIGAFTLKNFAPGCMYDIFVYSTKKSDIEYFFKTNFAIIKEFAGKELERDVVWFYTKKSTIPQFLPLLVKDESLSLTKIDQTFPEGDLYYIRIPIKEK